MMRLHFKMWKSITHNTIDTTIHNRKKVAGLPLINKEGKKSRRGKDRKGESKSHYV